MSGFLPLCPSIKRGITPISISFLSSYSHSSNIIQRVVVSVLLSSTDEDPCHFGRMKQKVVIRVQMDDEKKRRKAMKVAVRLPGVSSAAIEGADKNQIVVIGDGVDSVALTTSLRKNMGFADLISVAAVEEKKQDKKEDKKPEPTVQPLTVWPGYQPQYYYVPVAQDHHYPDPNCSIM